MNDAMTTTPLRIAVLGIGMMGRPIARRLKEAGHQVQVWNRTRAKAEPLTAFGITVHASPNEAVQNADMVISLLENGPVVGHVLFESGTARRCAKAPSSSTWPPSSPAKHGTTPPAWARWAWPTWMHLYQVGRWEQKTARSPSWWAGALKTLRRPSPCSPPAAAPPMWARTARASSPSWPTR